ncbi:hypothetical protein J3F83DRAFT_724813 [Trichoderma novae-zelandiae]
MDCNYYIGWIVTWVLLVIGWQFGLRRTRRESYETPVGECGCGNLLIIARSARRCPRPSNWRLAGRVMRLLVSISSLLEPWWCFFVNGDIRLGCSFVSSWTISIGASICWFHKLWVVVEAGGLAVRTKEVSRTGPVRDDGSSGSKIRHQPHGWLAVVLTVANHVRRLLSYFDQKSFETCHLDGLPGFCLSWIRDGVSRTTIKSRLQNTTQGLLPIRLRGSGIQR